MSSVLGTSAHVIKRGETLATIAKRYGVSVAALASANGLANPNRIIAGSTLVIPGSGAVPSAAKATTHTVAKGETLASIAKRYGTSTAALVSANGIKNPNLVVIGRKLSIPAGTAALASGGSAAYTVARPGDSVASIAKRFGVSADVIRAANGIVGDKLYSGARVLLAQRNTASLPAVTTSTYVVRSGDSLARIAGKTGTTVAAIASANGIKNPNLVTIGTTLTVPAGAGGAAFRCPVPGAKFVNDFGFPRAGGRFHEGNDLMAPRGTAILAPAAGTISHQTGSLAGNQVKLDADGGTVFYGMHLDRYGKTGRVNAGDVIGYVGNTGDARGGATHLHFEVHPGNGPAVNPYPSIVGRC